MAPICFWKYVIHIENIFALPNAYLKVLDCKERKKKLVWNANYLKANHFCCPVPNYTCSNLFQNKLMSDPSPL